MTRHTHPSPRLILLLAVLATVIVGMTFAGMGATDFVRQSECRTAAVAREMLDSGDFLIPTVNSRPRFEKPPLYYWAIALAAGATGGVDEVTARLPSVVCALLTVMGLGFFAWRRADLLAQPRAGAAWLAAVVLLSIPGFWQRASLADAESMLALACFFVTASLYWHLRQPRSSLLLWAYLGSAVAFMTKGPVFLLFTWPAYFWLARKEWWRDWRWHGRGLLLFLPLASAWYIAVQWHDPTAFEIFHKELAMRFDGKEVAHPEPIWFYFKQLLESTLPLGLFLPPALYAVWKRRGDRAETFLLANVAVAFGTLSLLTSKQAHYLLPVLPWLALWIADVAWANDRRPSWRWPARIWLGTGGVASVAAAILSYAYGLPWLATLFGLTALAGFLSACRTGSEPLPAAIFWTIVLVTSAYAANEAVLKPLRGLKFEHDTYFAALRQLAASQNLTVGFDDACFYYGYGNHASRPQEATEAAYRLDNMPPAAGGALRNYHAGRMEWLWRQDAKQSPSSSSLLTVTAGVPSPAEGITPQTVRQTSCLDASLWSGDESALLVLTVNSACPAHELLPDLKAAADALQTHLSPWKLLWLETGRAETGLRGWLSRRVLIRWIETSGVTVVLDSGGALSESGKREMPLILTGLPGEFRLIAAGDTLELIPAGSGETRRWLRHADGSRLILQSQR